MSGCWANDGEVPVNYYRCTDCGATGLTGEFWLPPEASLTSLDWDRRFKNRLAKRRERGVTHRTTDFRHGRRKTDDRIAIKIRIVPGQVERGLAKRLPLLRRKKVPIIGG